MQLTEDQIFALAPDEASKKAGKDLSTPTKWVSKGINEQAIWGECQGSGSKPYQTQVDIGTLTFKCSCPSRKFPCKHGLGLLLFHAKNNSSFTDTTPPQWVADWLAKRTERAEKKAEQKDKPVDEAAQAKRLQAREQLI
ncbi:MAG: SWIM zinc finger family protein, partial [Chitinophagaceae bacterium]|nr:SWIM zinc finger family protein [Chitinophagaceae bacterium]